MKLKLYIILDIVYNKANAIDNVQNVIEDFFQNS